jgi:hypothetical protein
VKSTKRNIAQRIRDSLKELDKANSKRKNRSGATYQKKLKAYRIDKTKPKDTTITIEQDLGDKKQVTTLRAHSFEEEEKYIPKKPSDDFVIVWKYETLKIKRCISTGKYYFYAGMFPNDKFICEIHIGSLYDMANIIFTDLGAITQTFNGAVKGRQYFRVTVKSRHKWLREKRRQGKA